MPFFNWGQKTQPPPPPPQGPIPIKLERPARDGVVCPFCMERFPVWELEFRSTSVDEDGQIGYPSRVDEQYVTFWDNVKQPVQNEEQGFVLRVTDRENVTEVRLWDGTWIPNRTENQAAIEKKAIWEVRDKFGNVTRQRICPHCHNALPDVIGRSPNYIISMMGNTSSGKTVYLSRMILSMINGGFLPTWGLTASAIFTDPKGPKTRPEVMASLKKMFSGRKEDDNRDVGKLASATPVRYMYPIILKLQKGYDTKLVTIFDFPGEAIWRLNSDQDLFFKKLMNRINENADGWLFILDSTTLDSVHSCILAHGDEDYISQGNVDDANLNADPGSVLMEFSDFFGGGNQIRTPVALIFSKADMIARYADELEAEGYHIGPDSPFLCDPPHTDRSKVDLDDLWRCDRAIQQFLEGDLVLTTARNLFRQHAWFAVSATGVPVKKAQMGNVVAPPRRVVEPLEWLLWMMGAFAGEYRYGNPLWGAVPGQDGDRG